MAGTKRKRSTHCKPPAGRSVSGERSVLLADFERDRAEAEARWAETADDLESISLRPHKTDIFVEEWGVVWVPYWDISFHQGATVQRLSLPAFESAGE